MGMKSCLVKLGLIWVLTGTLLAMIGVINKHYTDDVGLIGNIGLAMLIGGFFVGIFVFMYKILTTKDFDL